MTNARRWLPSRRFLVVLVVLVIVAGGSVLWKTKKVPPRTEETEVAAKNEEVPTVPSYVSTDSDGDGLMDWEEVLWDTDPNNADTDGDGTPDGEEVSAQRDPSVAGPDDRRADSEPPTSETPHTSFQALAEIQQSQTTTETEQLSRTLFAAYLDQQQTGGAVHPETLAAYILQTLQTQVPDSASPVRYTINDVSVSSSQNITTLRTYANAIGSVFQGAATANNNELLALGAFAQTGNPSTLDLEPVAEAYESRAASLGSISVPPSLVLEHLIMMNALANIGRTMREFQLLEQDPLQALVALQNYTLYSNEFQSATSAIGSFLKQSGVVFTGNEPGIVLTL